MKYDDIRNVGNKDKNWVLAVVQLQEEELAV